MLLEIEGLKAGFIVRDGFFEITHGIDLSIGENEVVGLVGESGCGKTVSALSVMRLLPQNGRIKSGSIIFEGRDLLSLSEAEMLKIRGEKIAMVFQEPFTALNPVIRAGEQIKEVLLARRVISKSQARDIAFELLERVHIGNPTRIYDSYPHQLSGGERQRILIATALSLGPKLLIADEPTTALDVTIQKGILNLLLELKNSMRMSILFITHDFGIINEVADRIFVMKDGLIVERGSKKEIFNLPQHPYTKRLLNAVPKIPDIEREQPSLPRDTFIEISSLSKSFPVERGLFREAVSRIEAVKGVSLLIRKGQTMGLVGESGCGKTTLGKLLLGLIEPDEGTIKIKGKDLEEYLKGTPLQIRQTLQIVFQDPYGSLDPRMTMGDIVLEGPAILGRSRPEKESMLKDVLEKVRMSLRDRYKYPHQFSGGERQRIAIARALAIKPQFLILDEPVSSLDVLVQKDILDLLRLLQKELGLTYLFISHDLRIVESMSDEVAVMYRGSIVEVAPSRNIYKNPQHPYTKQLLESIPVL